jgi:hypothetical protein
MHTTAPRSEAQPPSPPRNAAAFERQSLARSEGHGTLMHPHGTCES